MRSKATIFLVLVVAVVVMMLMTWLAVLAPPCADPPNSWMPCLDLSR